MTHCRLCDHPGLIELADFGLQPVSHRFLRHPDESEYLHPLSVGQCSACGMVQLIDMPPVEEVLPRFDWVAYNEPEAHLDALADRIGALPGLPERPVVCGLTTKDDSLLRRLAERGFITWQCQTALGVANPGAGTATIRQRLDVAAARRFESCDVVVGRRVFEHADEPLRLLEALRQLVRPGGYVVLEFPDCGRSMERGDVTVIWEERALYPTEATLKALPVRVVSFERVAYPIEDALIVVLDPHAPAPAGRNDDMGPEVSRGRAFANQLKRPQLGGNVVMFGAGHLACTWLNIYKIGVASVLDDHPSKKGLFMPGSHAPVCGSEVLRNGDIALCLLSLSPESELKVRDRYQAFLAGGGAFASIFPVSPSHRLLYSKNAQP